MVVQRRVTAEDPPPLVALRKRRSVAASVRRRNKGPSWRQALHSTASNVPAHTTLDEHLQNLPSGDQFGDNPARPNPEWTRVSFQNVQGVPDRTTDDKQRQISAWLIRECVSISLMAETNRYWPSVPRDHQWRERLRKDFPTGHFSSTSCNTKQTRVSTSTHQRGGCITSLLGSVAHGARTSGVDSSGLGRYAWCRIEGKSRTSSGVVTSEEQDTRSRTQDLIVVSAYRPCGPGQGVETVWAQHKDYLITVGRQDEDPRQAFVDDLIGAIEEWTSWGCEIILGIDANDDVSVDSPSSISFLFRQAGLQEAILQRHQQAPPATQVDNRSNKPIDGIFVTSGVVVKAGGYYGFYEGIESDHRALWIDIDLKSTLGGHSPTPKHSARKLTSKNRAVRRKYIRLAERGYQRQDIAGRLLQVHTDIQTSGGVPTPSQEHEFNLIHECARNIRREAEKKCRKIKGGGKPWSPKGQEIRDRIQLWRSL